MMYNIIKDILLIIMFIIISKDTILAYVLKLKNYLAIIFHKQNKTYGANNNVASLVIPNHICIIMDGNRRYGLQKYNNIFQGHLDGSNKLLDCIKWCIEYNIKTLTVYAFSKENWNRDNREILCLMEICNNFFQKYKNDFNHKNVNVKFLCSYTEKIPDNIQLMINKIEHTTATNVGLNLQVCFSYSGRSEIVETTKKIVEKVQENKLQIDNINENTFSKYLLTNRTQDPDIMIRTSGEKRLSNFLLYQLAYTEMIFVDKYWPAFEQTDFYFCLEEYSKRKRRYGK
eukprot:505266_1